MKNKRFLTVPVMCLLGAPFFISCDDDLSEDSHYAIPSFLKGNAYEVLQKDGNYKIFLKGVDLIGYKDVVDSQLLTVVAPSDEAFRTFLQKKGCETIEELYEKDPQYVTQLITYHLLYYAFDWEKMVNFRPMEGDGAAADEREINAGCYNRYRTRCTPPDTRAFNSSPSVNDSVTVYHLDRMMPVFSSKYFNTLNIDAKRNYEYFFKNSTWTGSDYAPGLSGGFNIANASVTDANSVITDNGYLYHVDQVIEPLKTIYEVLRDEEDYNTFFELYDSYSTYVLDEVETQNRGTAVYLHQHNDVPNIALEWYTSSYLNFALNTRLAYTLFVPTNAAIKTMFENFWKDSGYGNDVKNLDPLILQYFIMQAYAEDVRVCFPEEIENELIKTPFGTLVNIDPNKVSDPRMCCNGVIYGADNMDVPAIFSSVAGPAFKDVRYLPYLYALKGSDLMLSLASPETDFITLIPDTAQFTAEHMRLQKVLESNELQVWDDESGAYVALGSGVMTNMVNMNTSTNAVELSTDETQVIEANAPFNYWYVYDGKITTNALFNEQLNPSYTGDPFVAFHEIKRGEDKDWDNGKAYSYDYSGIFMPADGGKKLEYELAICQDKNYPYYVFSQLLRAANLIKDGTFTGSLTLDPESPRFIAMIPTNEAFKEMIKEIPGCANCSLDANYKLVGKPTATALAAYLCSYFITADRNSFTAYPYLGSTTKGKYDTGGTYGLEIYDDGETLSVGFYDKAGDGDASERNIVPVTGKYHYLPFAYTDGCFQLLDGVLK